MAWWIWALIVVAVIAIILLAINFFTPVRKEDEEIPQGGGLSKLRRAFGGGCGSNNGEEYF